MDARRAAIPAWFAHGAGRDEAHAFCVSSGLDSIGSTAVRPRLHRYSAQAFDAN
jgi:hypothetical protein